MDDSSSASASGTPARRSSPATPGLAIAAVWLVTVVSAILAPDMVTGSEHEHLPMAALTGWIWAIVATGYILMGSRGGRATPSFVLGTIVTWAVVGLAVAFGPTLVTGTDPTTTPLTVLLAPVAGAIVTGFLALDNLAR